MMSISPAEIVREATDVWLELGDSMLPEVVLSTLVANHLSDGQPVWMMVVAPPSSGKSALIQAVRDIEGVYPLGKLTGRTFASGMPGEDHSLLTELSEAGSWLLTHKDWGTIMSLPATERNEILGQLREIYDGRFEARYGSGAHVSWEGNLGFLVGATPAVDRLQKWSTELGERFVQFRPDPPDPQAVSIQAMLNAGRETEMGRALASAYSHAFVHATGEWADSGSLAPEGSLVAGAMSRLVAVARTPVHHERFGGGYEVSQPEGPPRLTGIFTQLYRAALCCYAGDGELATSLVVRVGLDSITPGVRRRLISYLGTQPWGIGVDGLGAVLGCDDNTARRHLDDLVALELADRTTPVTASVYRPSDKLRDLASEVYLDSYDPQAAIEKLCSLHTHHIHEGGEEEGGRVPTPPRSVGR